MISLPHRNEDARLTTNPYSSREPVKDPAQYYGRRDNLLKAAESIRNWEPAAITGEPRIGKTSFLHYLVHPDGARKQAAFLNYIGDPAAYLFVLIRPQLFPVKNAQGFWRYLFDRMVEEARAVDIDKESMEALEAIYRTSLEAENDDYQIQRNFEQYLKQVARKVLFLFDDFDILIEDFEPTQIRQVADKLRAFRDTLASINYIIISTDSLSRLFEKNNITSDLSPLPNIIASAPPLALLEEDAVHDLLQKPLQQIPDPASQFSPKDVTFIHTLAGRHPDCLKVSSFYLLEAKIQRDVDFRTVRYLIANDDRIQWLMKRLWERIKQDKPSLRETLLQIAQGQESTNQFALRELYQRGFVDDIASLPKVFGDLFREFILRAEKPDTISTEPVPPAAKLTSLEAKLYNYLAAHAGEICTREQIQQAIWGEKIPSSRDALEQLVRRLRGKIEADSEQPALLNIRGQGYLLRQPSTK